MDKGRLRVGLSMTGSYVHASHMVAPDQREPGVPLAQQPAEHVLDLGLLQWDLDAQAGLHRRFAFELQLPVRTTIIDATFLDDEGVTLPQGRSIHHRDETIAGVGDVVLSGRIGLVLPQDVPRWTLALRTGLSLPTGRTRPNPFVLGAQGKEHQHMFFGTGTFDPVLGLDTNVAFDRWTLVGWTFAKLPLYSNDFGYRGSRLVVGGVGAQSSFGLRRWSLLVQPEAYFETPARWTTQADVNSGRTSLVATAGVFFMPAPGWQLHLLAKVPYYTAARGGQLEWPFVGLLGFTYTFDVKQP